MRVESSLLLTLFNQASSKLGASQDIPTLVRSEDSSSDSYEVTSSNEEGTNGERSKQAKKKKLQKRKNKKKHGDTSVEVFKQMLEEQKKQMKTLEMR